MKVKEKVAVETKAYAAIRSTDGKLWIDTETISHSLDTSIFKATNLNKRCGIQWAKDNPVSHFSEFDILENHETNVDMAWYGEYKLDNLNA